MKRAVLSLLLAIGAAWVITQTHPVLAWRGMMLLRGYVTNAHRQIVYSIHARSTSCPEDVDRTLVLVPMGQSNAANSVFGWMEPLDDRRVTNFYSGQCYRVTPPLLGTSGRRGSLWPALAKSILDETNWAHVVLAPMAAGGSSIAQWATGGDLRPIAEARLSDLKSHGFRHVLFLWHQGETDNDLGTGPQTYAARLQDLITSTRAYFPGAPFFVSIASRCADYGPSLVLAAAQLSVVNPQLGVYQGPDTDVLGEAFRADRCHFNVRGAEAALASWRRAISTHETQRDLARQSARNH